MSDVNISVLTSTKFVVLSPSLFRYRSLKGNSFFSLPVFVLRLSVTNLEIYTGVDQFYPPSLDTRDRPPVNGFFLPSNLKSSMVWAFKDGGFIFLESYKIDTDRREFKKTKTFNEKLKIPKYFQHVYKKTRFKMK